jgi:lipopolysaccharide/colanic/teichoic acid biosynthesis glycosyltransferase
MRQTATFYERHGKRVLDVAAAAVALPVLAPLMGTIAGALLATQGRPVLYRQERIGKDGEPFRIYKFRTMTIGAESQGEGLWYVKDDPRITPLGGLLRSTSLDELPQFLNVLRGEMSLVGPRPKPREIVDRYRSRYAQTLRVRPGITCLTAIEGRNQLRRSEMIECDQRYAHRVTLREDLRILLLTVPVVLFRRGFFVADRSEGFTEDVEPDAA